MKTYIITNDRYSNQPDEVTFEQLVEMCQDLGWDVTLEEKFGVDAQWPLAIVVWDQNGETVAVEKSAYEASYAD